MYIPLETLEGLAIDLSFTSGQIEARLVGKQLREVVAKLRDALGTVCDVMPVADIENWKNLDEVDFDQAHHILQGNLNSSGNLRIRTLGFSYLDDEGKRIERPAQVTIRKKIPRRGNSTELASQEAKSQIENREIAMKMLNDNGIYDVKVVPAKGMLTDHYNPATKTVALSEGVYASRSVAAAAVAAHECGHAVQHAKGYAPLKMRSALVPVVSFASNIVQWVLLVGILVINTFPELLWFGIGLFALTTLFSFITLPVEINASQRAIAWLDSTGITDYETRPMAIDALKWAAYTYVVAAIGSLATLLYYIGIARRD